MSVSQPRNHIFIFTFILVIIFVGLGSNSVMGLEVGIKTPRDSIQHGVIDDLADIPGAVWDYITGKIADGIDTVTDVMVGMFDWVYDAVWGPFLDDQVEQSSDPVYMSLNLILVVIYCIAIYFLIRIYTFALDIIPMI